jgi:hypothetical protein
MFCFPLFHYLTMVAVVMGKIRIFHFLTYYSFEKFVFYEKYIETYVFLDFCISLLFAINNANYGRRTKLQVV